MDNECLVPSDEIEVIDSSMDKPAKYAKYDDNHVFNKLVRDNVPEIIKKFGLCCHTMVINDGPTLLRLLAEKVREEANEVFDACNVFESEEGYTDEDLWEELGDLFEAVEAIQHHFPAMSRRAMEVQAKKRESHGAFTERIFLIKTESMNTEEN